MEEYSTLQLRTSGAAAGVAALLRLELLEALLELLMFELALGEGSPQVFDDFRGRFA